MPTAASAARRRSTRCCLFLSWPLPLPPFHLQRPQQRLVACAIRSRGVSEAIERFPSPFAAARQDKRFIFRSSSSNSFFYSGTNRAATIRSSCSILMEEGQKSRQRLFSSEADKARKDFPTKFGDSRHTISSTSSTAPSLSSSHNISNQQRSRRNVHFEINQRILELGRQQQWRSLLEYVLEHGQAVNNVNLATALTQLARSSSSSSSSSRHSSSSCGASVSVVQGAPFQQLLQAVAVTCERRGLPWMGARETANILHALGRLRAAPHSRPHDDAPNNHNHNNNPSVQRILAWVTAPETAVSLVQQAGRPQEVGNVAWALVRLECGATRARPFLAAADERAAWILERGTLQDAANVAWACAKMGHPAPRLFRAINRADLAQRLVRQGKPQDIANVVWACAKLSHPTPRLFEILERHAIQLFVNTNNDQQNGRRWNPQDLSNTLWACATLGHRVPKLFAAIEACHAEFLVAKGKPQEVSNAAWAFATLQVVPAPRLFRAVGGGGHGDTNTPRRLVRQGTPQTIANTSWAFAVTSYGREVAPPWFAAVQEHRSDWLRDGVAARHVASIAWSFATLQWDAPDLLRDVDRHAGQWDAPGAQELSNTLYALATLGFAAPHLCAAMEEASTTELSSSFLDGLLTQGSAQEVCNTTWAYSTLALLRGDGVLDTTCLCMLWDRALELFLQNESRFANQALYQLAQTQLFARAEGVELQEIPEHMSERMVQALDALDGNMKSSGSEEISKLLEDLGVEHQFEVAPNDISTTISTRGKLLATDLACPRLKVAIEFDGPTHYLRALGSCQHPQRTTTENGSTQAKRRLYQQFGWTVVNIDYREFNGAKQCRPDLKEWLREKLHAAGVAPSAD